jgi:hypothetical protein
VRARDNPFAVRRVLEIRYRLAGATWEELMERLAVLGMRVAIVGPHGHGKTTLLEDLGARLQEQGFRLRTVTLHTGDRRLSAEQRRTLFHDLSPSELLLLDGAEQLGRFAWREVRTRTRAAGGLVITSHRPDLLPTLYECRTTPELLDEVLRDLLGSEPEMPVADLFARHGGNLREALREMYDVYARVPTTPRFLRPGPGDLRTTASAGADPYG